MTKHAVEWSYVLFLISDVCCITWNTENEPHLSHNFLDFSKAFDTVNHTILLRKLEAYGIRGTPLNWFQSYLTNRKQYVELDGVKSPKQTMLCGIPQGSTLGPLLFLIYINDLPNSSQKLSFKIFADDSKVFASARDLKTTRLVVSFQLSSLSCLTCARTLARIYGTFNVKMGFFR